MHTYEFYEALQFFSIIHGPDEGQTAFCGCILCLDRIRLCRNLQVQIGRCMSPGERMFGRAGESGKKLRQQLKPCKHSPNNIIVKIHLKISIHMKDL